MKTDEDAMELALITSIIINEDMLGGSVVGTFDRAYALAHKFLKLYPSDYIWEDEALDYDETIINFVKNSRR